MGENSRFEVYEGEVSKAAKLLEVFYVKSRGREKSKAFWEVERINILELERKKISGFVIEIVRRQVKRCKSDILKNVL